MSWGTISEPLKVGDVVLWESGIEVVYARELRSIAGAASETWEIGSVLEGSGKVAVAGNADGILLKRLTFDAVPTAQVAPVLVRDSVVNSERLDYNGQSASAVQAALLALGIVSRPEGYKHET